MSNFEVESKYRCVTVDENNEELSRRDLLNNFSKVMKARRNENKSQKEYIEKLEKLVLNCYEACLCQRFETKGFDYGETHPVLGCEKGSRFNTPTTMIKNTIGYEWVYKDPTKPGHSMERLKFQTIKHGEGYKSDKEWKEIDRTSSSIGEAQNG